MQRALALIALAFLAPALAGCVSPADDPGMPADTEPMTPEPTIFELPETISGLEAIGNPGTSGAAGIWVEDDLAYLSGPAGLRIYDVTDPANPVEVATEVEATSSRDVDLIHHPDGKLYAILARGAAGMALVDVTDPAEPVVVNQLGISSHNLAVVPNTTIVYNSRSISLHTPEPGTTGALDIIDYANPEDPAVTVFKFPAVAMTVGGVPRTVQSTACHDVTFLMEKNYAYCAGVTDTQIWSIEDPLDPQVIQVIDWPGTNIHHAVWPARGGDLLIIGDEFAGAMGGPMCNENVGYPTAGLWFFDVSDMRTPTPAGYFQVKYDSPTEGDTSLCTTHFGTLIEDRDLLVMSWYTGGTVIVDFTNPMAAKQVAHFRPEGSVNTWESRYYNGHVYTGDTARGMDILKIV